MGDEPFKLDMLMLHHVIATGSPEQWGERAGIELARQLHAAGAPDVPFEGQVRELLAAYLAMQQAGEGMPSEEALNDAMCVAVDTGGLDASRGALDLFRPTIARLTQRAEYSERGRVTWADAARGWQADFEAERSAHAVARARIAELEPRRVEPSADVVARIAGVLANMADFSPPARERAAMTILSFLAEMGWEAIPSHGDTIRAAAEQWQDAASRCGFHAGAQWYGARLAPVIAAQRAELVAKGKRIAELEAQADRANTRRFSREPRPDDDPEGVTESFATSALDK